MDLVPSLNTLGPGIIKSGPNRIHLFFFFFLWFSSLKGDDVFYYKHSDKKLEEQALHHSFIQNTKHHFKHQPRSHFSQKISNKVSLLSGKKSNCVPQRETTATSLSIIMVTQKSSTVQEVLGYCQSIFHAISIQTYDTVIDLTTFFCRLFKTYLQASRWLRSHFCIIKNSPCVEELQAVCHLLKNEIIISSFFIQNYDFSRYLSADLTPSFTSIHTTALITHLNIIIFLVPHYGSSWYIFTHLTPITHCLFHLFHATTSSKTFKCTNLPTATSS